MLSEKIHLSELPKPLSKVKESCLVQQRPKQLNCSTGGRPTMSLPPNLLCNFGPGPAPLEAHFSGQGTPAESWRLLETRSGLAENPRARQTPAGVSWPGPALQETAGARWKSHPAGSSGKQLQEAPGQATALPGQPENQMPGGPGQKSAFSRCRNPILQD